MSQINFDYFECEIFPFIVIGAEMVGKSSLVNRFVDDSFNENITRTLAIDFKAKRIVNTNNSMKIVRIWDTAGQERYNSITQGYYRQGDCILLCFSIINRLSFEKLDYFISMIKKFAKTDALIMLIGTHQDKENIRTISQQEIKEYASFYNYEYFEISSKTGVGVNELFNRCIEILSKNKKNIIYDNQGYYLNENNKNNKKVYHNQCCIIS